MGIQIYKRQMCTDLEQVAAGLPSYSSTDYIALESPQAIVKSCEQ